jgi:hypothetical protein
MSIQTPFRKVATSLKRRGPIGTAIWLGDVLRRRLLYYRRGRDYVSRGGHAKKDVDDGFDDQYGVDTKGYVKLADLEIDTRSWVYGVDYQAVPAKFFNDILSRLQIRHEDFVFIDLGSGKGKPLLLASEFPFKRIIGVEFSQDLHRIAQQNIQNYKSDTQKCKNLESVCMDATKYPLPEEPTVYHLYHPFGEKVMSVMLDRIRASLEQHPRQVFLVYAYPAVHQLMDRAAFLKLIDSGESFRIYSNT